MHPAGYAEFLAEKIRMLASELAALQPSWRVPSLRRSYTEAQVRAALLSDYRAR